jgi:hypothetical protein
MPGYEKKLSEKRHVDALVEFTLADAPPRIQQIPRWLMKLLLLLLVSCSHQYRQMLNLLDQNLREWQEIARLDGCCEHYREVGAGVLLLYGGRSDSKAVTLAMERLAESRPCKCSILLAYGAGSSGWTRTCSRGARSVAARLDPEDRPGRHRRERSEWMWLAALDDFRNWLIREAA